MGSVVEMLKNFKFLGINFSEDQSWSLLVDPITQKAHQWVSFVRIESPLFKAARQNDVETLKNLIEEKHIDPYERGTVGETVLHVAALYNSKEAAIILLNAFPFLIDEPIDCEMYKGETALHIAVVNQNVDLIKELLALNADIKHSRAVGTFFTPGKDCRCYYGEYVLSFAACIGNEQIVKMIVAHGAPLNAQDKQGNTVFHMLVLHPNKSMACRMYNFISSLISKEKIEYLENITNKDGLTPMKLSAFEGDVAMFSHFMQKRKQIYWAFGPVSSTLYDLTGIDTWGDELSVLDILCSSKKKEHQITLLLPCPRLIFINEMATHTASFINARKLLKITPVKEVLHHKWTNYGFKYFLLWTALYFLYTIIFTVCCVYRPLAPAGPDGDNITIMVPKPLNFQEPLWKYCLTKGVIHRKKILQDGEGGEDFSDKENPRNRCTGPREKKEAYVSAEDFARLAGEILTVVGAVLILVTEIPRLIHIGPAKYFGNTVTGGPFHITMIVYACFVLITMILRVLNHEWETVIMAYALISAWCNVLYFARGFKLLGPLCIMIQKMIFGDLMRFCYVLIIVIIGFGAGFDVHFQALDPNTYLYFRDFTITIFTLFQLMMGLTELPGPPDIKIPDIIIVLYMVYMCFGFVLLLNLFIALMGDTHYRVVSERKSLWKAQIAATTLLLERRLPAWLWPRAGIPGDLLGLNVDKWYLRVEERSDYQKARKKAEDEEKENITHPRKNRSAYRWKLIHKNISKSLKKNDVPIRLAQLEQMGNGNNAATCSKYSNGCWSTATEMFFIKLLVTGNISPGMTTTLILPRSQVCSDVGSSEEKYDSFGFLSACIDNHCL
ncbi:transient receptor potential cation channel subfamily V member 5-like [Narcine bancroftii]|uniref:transient receptor potential cation channel subfamily V member 5-like n=1 Tax=Narcine bancroftii TaxID=1343680 RepID=UPI003831198D